MSVKISALLPKKAQVDTGNGMLEVGHIDLQGITKLLQDFKEPLLQLIASSSQGSPDFAAMAATAPKMIVDMIAMGAGATGQEEDIAQLPFGVQAIAAGTIWELSVPDPKKLVSVLSTVLGQLKPPAPQVKRADVTKE